MAAKPTKSTTLTGAYQRLCTLYDASQTTIIPFGDGAANKVVLTGLVKTIDLAWGETEPAIAGHQIGIGDTCTIFGLAEIGLAWLKNTVAAETATVIITPFQEFG